MQNQNSVCMYFQVHQPARLRKFTVFDIGGKPEYFDDRMNKFYLDRISRKCYLPTNQKLLELIERHKGRFRVSFSITGVLLEQLEQFRPDVLESFQRLVDTGCVELFAETYYHSLSYLISKKEFAEQVRLHGKKMKSTFGVKPGVFRNTEAMYSNDIAKTVEDMGYKGILAEGLDHILTWRSPNYLYNPPGSGISVFLRNFKLSDDIGFRFSRKDWEGWPLTADKFAAWLAGSSGDTMNIFIDYETFGEHQWEDTGIFNFLSHLPDEVLKHDHLAFRTPSEIIRLARSVGEYDVPYISSWADVHRDLSAWLENSMQQQAFNEIKSLGRFFNGTKKPVDKKLLSDWRKLQTSDHFYYMCTKWFADGDVHKYFNHYSTPYDAFLNFMNIAADIKMRAEKSTI